MEYRIIRNRNISKGRSTLLRIGAYTTLFTDDFIRIRLLPTIDFSVERERYKEEKRGIRKEISFYISWILWSAGIDYIRTSEINYKKIKDDRDDRHSK